MPLQEMNNCLPDYETWKITKQKYWNLIIDASKFEIIQVPWNLCVNACLNGVSKSLLGKLFNKKICIGM